MHSGHDDVRVPSKFGLHSLANAEDIIPEQADGIHAADYERRLAGLERKAAREEIIVDGGGAPVVVESGHEYGPFGKIGRNDAGGGARAHFCESGEGEEYEGD